MYLMIKRVLFCLSFALLFLGCTNKDNKITITQSGLIPLAGEINSITEQFSFRDTISVNGENYKLFVSNTEEIESQAILSFAYLPENVESITDATLTLYSDVKPAGTIEFRLKLLEQEYLESSANWNEASSGVPWDDELLFDSQVEPVISADTIATTVDSLVFDLSNEEILNWTEKEQSLFSLLLYTESDNYIELFSSEHSKRPVLKFTYKLNSDATDAEDREYNRNAFKDTSIINDKSDSQETWSSKLEFSNIPPKKSFLKFEVNANNLVNQDGESLTDFQKKHLTINSAYLRLYIKAPMFLGSRTIYLTPFIVKSEITEATVIDSDNMEYLINTGTSTAIVVSEPDSTQFIDLKITPILQGYISGEKDNNGLVFRSSYQSTNFDAVEFYGKDEDENLRPKVKFIYTLPLE